MQLQISVLTITWLFYLRTQDRVKCEILSSSTSTPCLLSKLAVNYVVCSQYTDVRGCLHVCVCVYICMCALKIVSPDKILCSMVYFNNY